MLYGSTTIFCSLESYKTSNLRPRLLIVRLRELVVLRGGRVDRRRQLRRGRGLGHLRSQRRDGSGDRALRRRSLEDRGRLGRALLLGEALVIGRRGRRRGLDGAGLVVLRSVLKILGF